MPFGEFLALTSQFIPASRGLEMFPTLERQRDEAAKECPGALWQTLSSERLIQMLSEQETSRIVTLTFHADTANVYVQDAETSKQIGFLVTWDARKIFEKWHHGNG
jgi:hypothetical protein